MAQCDQGYLCEVCGDPVEFVEGSDLYLRYILGEVEARALLSTPERHLRCNPVVAQFIVDPAFETVTVDGPFNKAEMDQAWDGKVKDTGFKMTIAYNEGNEARKTAAEILAANLCL